MIVCSTSSEAVGCTFLDWTINFVTGQSRFYNINNRQWIPLSQNPVTDINAHGHNKNHPSGIAKTKQALDQLRLLPSHDLYSIYPHPLHLDTSAEDLGIAVSKIDQEHNQSRISQYRTQDYNQLLSHVADHARVIFVSGSKDLNLYHRVIRSTGRMLLTPKPARSTAEMHDEMDNAFYSGSIEYWKRLGLTDIWDIRERRALQRNLIYFNHGLGELKTDLSFDHYWIDCRNWWFNGDDAIQDIIQWLGLQIDTKRYQQWITIYHAWQKMQAKHLKFQFNSQHIVDSIVNNWSYSIDLSFDEEVVIQHCLIYQHNLNFKTWQLEKFPNDTQQLHMLLEPNIHVI
jgi:hypothetical protein